jgi:uncharacterized protein (TIGR03437 family)
MVRTYFLAAGLAALAVTSLSAQNAPLASGTVGVPYSVDLGSEFAMISEEIAQLGDGISFTFTFTATNLPPGLTMQTNGILGGTPTTAGTFAVTISIEEDLVFQGATVFDETVPIPFELVIGGSSTGGMSTVDPAGLTFQFSAGMTAAASQTLSLSNPTSQTKTFTVSATTIAGGSWLSVSPSSGSLAPFVAGSINVTVNPAGLVPNTYTGLITVKVSPTGESFVIPVNALIASSQQSIVLSQSGFRFQAVQGGGAPPTQSLTVINGGPGTLNFSAAASTTSGGNWLSVSPATGSSNATSAGALAVSVNPSGLAPGDYYGQIAVSSSSAGNSPQIATVVLNVTTAANSPGLSFSSTGLIFVAAAKGANPAAKSIVVSNPSPTPVMVGVSASSSPAGIFTVTESAPTVFSDGPVTVQVQTNISGLAPGPYLGELDVSGSDGSFHRIVLLLVLTPGAGAAAVQTTTSAADSAIATTTTANCTPQKLLPVFTQLGSGFNVAAGWPVPLELTIVDDCGNFLTGGGSVIASFTSGDPAISLNSLKDGRWVATWQPHVAAPQVTITGNATEIQPALHGSAQLGGALMPNPAVPIVGAGGVVSGASYAKQAPVAPGGIVSIFGVSLSGGMFASEQLPLATNLGGTQVSLGGQLLPLLIENSGQINAVLPFNLPANSVQQLVVQTNSSLSLPEPITIASGAPGIFAQNSQGTGAGSIQDYPASGGFFNVDSTHPASAGDVLVIYCTGLGPVTPPVAAGSSSPSSPAAKTVNTVTLTIGGMSAGVDFAGLTPGFTGLYQINTVVPNGLTAGEQPVVITVAGQQSPAAVTLNVH